MSLLLRRLLPAVIVACVVWAVASSLFTVDVTEYGLVTRFGRVVRVVAEPGLHVTAPFDRVVRGFNQSVSSSGYTESDRGSFTRWRAMAAGCLRFARAERKSTRTERLRRRGVSEIF